MTAAAIPLSCAGALPRPLQSVIGHLTWLTVSAALLAAAFPRPGWAWLAHVALVPAVLLAVRSPNTRRLAWTSYGVAVASWLIGLRWLMPVTAGGTLVLALYLALYLPATLVAVRLLDRARPGVMVLTLPVVWVALELARTHYPAGGFAWFCLGHSQAPWAPEHGPARLIQIADLLGEHGVSFLVAMTNGMAVDLLRRPWRLNRAPAVGRTASASVIIWLVATCGAWLYGGYRIEQTHRVARHSDLRVAVIQTNVPQDNKDSPNRQQLMSDWQRMVELTRQCVTAHPDTQLIVWPETMVPVALNPDALGHYRASGTGLEFFNDQIQDLARDLGTHLMVGAPAYRDWQQVALSNGLGSDWLPGQRYNSVYHYRPDGSQAPQNYDKVHRVPFGEYIPWVEDWPWLKRLFIEYLSPYEVDYTLQAGQAWTVFHIPDDSTAPTAEQASSRSLASGAIRLSTPICFEDAVARVTRAMVFDARGQKRTDFLVNLTNDGWYAGTSQGPQHLQIAVFRCVETRTPMARSVNTGVSGFIDSVGRVGPLVNLQDRTQQVEGFATATVTFDERLTVFGRWGEATAVGLIATGGLAVAAWPWVFGLMLPTTAWRPDP